MPATAATGSVAPGTIVVGARGVVGDGHYDRGVAIRAHDGVVVDVRERHEDDLVAVEIDGWLTGGFTDAHTHFAFGVDRAGSADLAQAAGPREAVDLLRRAARSRDRQWLVGRGYWPPVDDRPLSRRDLDLVTTQVPVVVELGSGHTGILNSTALEAAGYRASGDAPEGGRIEVDEAGEPTGAVHERAFYRLLQGVGEEHPVAGRPVPTDADVAEVGRQFRQAGITGICEAHVGGRELEILRRAAVMGALPPRVWCLLTPELARSWDDDGRPQLAGLPDADVVGVKVYADGSLGGATCAVSSIYRQGNATAEAEWNTPLAELAELMGEFHRRRLSVAVHVNGDEAVEAVVGIFAALLADDPWPDHAHRLEHASFVPRRLAITLSRLGLTVVTFTGYLHRLGGRLADLYGVSALSDVAPVAALLEGDVRVMGSSDFPCGPLDPIEGIEFLVRRIGADGTPVNPAEGIEPQEAVRLFSWSWSRSSPQAPDAGLTGRRLSDLIALDGDLRSLGEGRVPSVIGSVSERGELMDVR